MINPKTNKISSIKKEQKESLLLREISALLLQLSLDDSKLTGLTISRVSLSSDKSICTVYIFTSGGLDEFKDKLAILKLYKPSMRKALSQEIKGRYVPDIKFRFDEQFEKQRRLEELLEKVKGEDQL